jgi:hypothetical protein
MRGIEWLIVQDWGAVGIHEWKGRCFIHCQIWEWSLEHRRDCNTHWAAFLDAIRARGYGRIYAVCSEGDGKGIRFRRMFGFDKEVGRTGGFILMEQEI